jgi:hypothetical protein
VQTKHDEGNGSAQGTKEAGRKPKCVLHKNVGSTDMVCCLTMPHWSWICFAKHKRPTSVVSYGFVVMGVLVSS